jgi:hypothetical protein
MKVRKNISLSRQAVAAGEALAAEQGTNFSKVVEQSLSAAPRLRNAPVEDFWDGPALKPVRRKGDRRHDYLQRKHA